VPLGRPPADLSGVPAWTLRPDRVLARVHRIGNDPRYFGVSGESRFDLAAPRGTLYAAETPVGAFLEVFRAAPFVPQAEVDGRLLAGIRSPDERRLADCTAARARRFGVTAAIHSTPDYAACQRWAAAFADASFGGVRYRVSHDPSAREVALALFGDEGADESFVVDEDGPIPRTVLDEVRSRFGITVIPTPG
jgi:RES domain